MIRVFTRILLFLCFLVYNIGIIHLSNLYFASYTPLQWANLMTAGIHSHGHERDLLISWGMLFLPFLLWFYYAYRIIRLIASAILFLGRSVTGAVSQATTTATHLSQRPVKKSQPPQREEKARQTRSTPPPNHKPASSPPPPKVPDCFVILGFKTTRVTEQDIKHRFNEKVKLAHPDKGGRPDEFRRLVKAKKDAIAYVKAGR